MVGALIDDLSETARGGLIAYGHRDKTDCADIETVVPVGPLDRRR